MNLLEFRIKKREHPNIEKYKREDMEIAVEFSRRLQKEVGDLVGAVVLFGSVVRGSELVRESDIDVLAIVDDVKVTINPEAVEAYRIIIEKLVQRVSKRLHVTTLKLSNFWDYMRVGDPIGINMLRDGMPLYDVGFFEPLQMLLRQGRIRPTEESIWTYFAKAPTTLYNSRWHLLQGALDLYWAVIDSAHAALMSIGELPPTPSHVADMMEEKMAKRKLINAKYVKIMRDFYKLSRMIMHREIKEISGQEFEIYYKDADDFVEEMRKFIEKQKR